MTPARLFIIAGCAFVAMSTSSAVFAASTGGCESFDFPVATDLQWMLATDAEKVASGAKFSAPPAKAMDVTLQPVADVKFAVPPGGKTKDGEAAFGAVIAIDGVSPPGLYQVSLADRGWIDVVQGGVTLKAAAHTGKSDCQGLRKSVRFEVKEGPVTLQLSGITSTSIKITFRKAD